MGIEYVVGSESHTSYWGKFYVKGLESWEVKEEHDANRRDGHHSYAFLMADAPQGTVFTIFEQNGSKRGTDEFIFKICVVIDGDGIEHKAAYGSGFCNGNYEVLAEASGKVKAPRLMDWWQAKPKGVNAALYARHCAEHIERRGVKDLPAMPIATNLPAVA